MSYGWLVLNVIVFCMAVTSSIGSLYAARAAINAVDELDLYWRRYRQASRKLAASRDRRLRRAY